MGSQHPFERCWPCWLIGELIAGRGGGIEPLTTASTAALAIVVMVVVHLHVPAVRTPISATGTAGELDLLIQLDSFLDIDLFHSDFSFQSK